MGDTFPTNTQSIMVDTTMNTYVTVNTKQYDLGTRFLRVYLVNSGLPINFAEYPDLFPVFRMLTPDGRHVWNNDCIQVDTTDNCLLVTLPRDALTAAGKGTANIDFYNTVIDESTATVESQCLSTICFYIYVLRSAFDDGEIRLADDWQAFAEILNGAKGSELLAEQYKEAAKASSESAEIFANNAATSAVSAANDAQAASDSEDQAEAWAVGQIDGADVAETATQYHNNAKYYADLSSQNQTDAKNYREQSEAWAVGQIYGDDVAETDLQHNNNAKYYAEDAAKSAAAAQQSLEDAGYVYFDIDDRGHLIELYSDTRTDFTFSVNEATGNLILEVSL